MPRMTTMEQPFFDPVMAELQRRLALGVEQGTADLTLQSQRLQQDYNLLMGTPEAPGRVRRQFARDAERTAGNIAGRGFHGQRSGPMRRGMGQLALEQGDQLGQLGLNYTRQQEDIQRAIANMEQHGVIEGSEATRGGAGRASDRLVQRLPF